MTNEEAISVIENEIQIDVRLCTDEQVDRFQTALYMAISALRAEPTGDALTLEQLREMDGQPVWVHVIDHTIFADKKDDFDGWGMCRKSWVRIWDSKRADIVHIDYDFEDYGKDWLAYAYPPARIDREAWTAEWIYPDNEWNLPRCSKCGCNSKDATYGHKDKFCPKCGRAMTPEAWAELEEVKRVLAMMWYAYENKDREAPHEYEIEARRAADKVLGPWAECMPKYLRNSQESSLCDTCAHPFDEVCKGCSDGDRYEPKAPADPAKAMDEITEFTRDQWDWLMGRFTRKED